MIILFRHLLDQDEHDKLCGRKLNFGDVGCCRYKTGSLTPLIEWLSRAMDRAAVPPQPPRPAARAENVPPAARQGNDNAALPGNLLLVFAKCIIILDYMLHYELHNIDVQNQGIAPWK